MKVHFRFTLPHKIRLKEYLERSDPDCASDLQLQAKAASQDAMKAFWKEGPAADRELTRLIWDCADTWRKETGKFPEDLLFEAPACMTNSILPILDALGIEMEHSTLIAILHRAPTMTPGSDFHRRK